MPLIVPMLGKTFGRLTVTEFVYTNKGANDRQARWKCVCLCGKDKIVRGVDLRNGNTKTCGCRIGREFSNSITKERSRVCEECQNNKLLTEFIFSRQKKFHSRRCKECMNAKRRTYPSLIKSQIEARDRKRACRDVALAHYGNKCGCCGETEKVFLAFDHINGGGNQHRGDIKRQRFSTIGEWLVDNGFPKDFQILCFNCNWAKHANKICSHKLNQHVSMLSFGC